jgi:hypothetical protein
MTAASPLDRTFRQIARDHRKFRRRLDRLERWDVDDYEVGGNLGTMDDAPNDGSADVRGAFEEAIENLDDEGGKLEIPAGTYRMDSGLAITKRVKIVGEGKNRTIINCNFASGDLLTFSGAGSKVDGISFQSTVTRTSGSYLVLNAADIIVDDCELLNYFGGIWMLGTCNKCAIRECVFQTDRTADGGVAINVRGTANRVAHCRFTGVLSGASTVAASYPHQAIVLGDADGAAHKTTVAQCRIELHRIGLLAAAIGGGQTTIEDCRVTDYGSNGLLLQPVAAEFVDDLRVVKSSFDTPGPNDAHAIRIRGATGAGIRDVVFRDCEARGGTTGSYGAYSDGTNVEGLEFHGGKYNGSNQSGIYVIQHATGSKVKVRGITAKNNGFAGVRFGTGVEYGLHQNHLGGNGSYPVYDDDIGGRPGGRGKKKNKQRSGNFPDNANDDFDGLELLDDGTDQTATLQAIHDALSVAGGTIRLPEGSFTVTGPITLAKPVKIVGKGRNATRLILNHASNQLFAVNVAGCIFQDFSVRQSVARTAVAVYVADGADNCVFKELYFENQYASIQLYADNAKLDEVQCATNLAGRQIEANGAGHVIRKCHLSQLSGTRIGRGIVIGFDQVAVDRDVTVKDCVVDGFDWGIGILRSDDGLSISDCKLRNCQGGWFIDPGLGITNNGTKIANVTVNNAQAYGAYISRDGGGVITNLAVSNNSALGGGCSAAGFYIFGSAGTIRNLTLRGCKAEGLTGDGFFINAAISDWKITDCTARSNTGWGCRVIAGNTAYTVSNNRFKNNTAGNFQDLSRSTDRQGKANDPDDVNVVLRCRAHHSVNQSVVTGTALWTWVEFNVEDEDVEGMHPTNADNAQFQIKTAGVYSIHFEGNFEQNSDGHRKGRIVRERLGSQTRIAYKRRAAVGGDRTTIDLHCKRRFQANDIVMVQVSQNSGVTLNLETEGGAGESTADIGPTITIEKVEG